MREFWWKLVVYLSVITLVLLMSIPSMSFSPHGVVDTWEKRFMELEFSNPHIKEWMQDYLINRSIEVGETRSGLK